ncbi:iron-containing alcohol dehydrogenase [Bacteroides sp. GD17]|jgi:alcohol dehydrogenase YqhD (iron-dependent ADH family)|uniref:iron-containing alcohol dehydrogenase n=1 Tax=Bacteroides sp. GD17 TaxID=3139826 RepID=UPI0025F4D7EF|nr:iron-containing alcohol dehydrogenase [uncultured Bacteroides sp.]
MKDFNFYAPTEVVFGATAEEQTGKLIRRYGGKKVLVHYGGKSVERSGLLDKVCRLLEAEGLAYVKLGGVVPNPRLSMVHAGIGLCRKENIDFILAVGGGSVIDSSKAIAYGVPYDGDVWDFYTGAAEPHATLPVGTVLTIPAAGSEMSNSSVITNEAGGIKLGYSNNIARCKFAVMNPERSYTLPPYQTACGAVDIMMHTMERYFSHEDDMTLTDELAEALLRTVKDSTLEVLACPTDYRHRAQIMWAGSLAHNDLTGCGTVGDFATHMLEHELSALFDVAHGAGLAAVWGSWARYVYKENIARFVRFAVNVMGITNDFTRPEHTVLLGIRAMEDFYRTIGMPTTIKELIGRDITDEETDKMADKCSHNATITVGNFKKLSREDMKNIYRLASK